MWPAAMRGPAGDLASSVSDNSGRMVVTVALALGPDTPILSGDLVWHVVLVTLLLLAACYGVFTFAMDRGYPLALAQTMTMNMLVVLEIFHLFFIRNIYGTSLTLAAIRGTPVVWAVVILIVGAQFAITYLPQFQVVLGTQAMPVWDGVLLAAIGAAFFVILEVEKQIRLSLAQPWLENK
jgi:magnesium-transporting ATPase (P-type)